MIIRLGYVSISKTLDITSSSTITYTNFKKSKDLKKLNRIILSNLKNLKQIIIYNIKNNIHFYRLTSALIPLATHNEVDFDYIEDYEAYYLEIGTLINSSTMRVDVHPDQFVVLNSVKKEVFDNSLKALEYHYLILSKMNIKPLIILHVGSNVFGKKASLYRFINSFKKLPLHIQKSIALENDDKVFNIDNVLRLCEKLDIPCVLDYHHHLCNHDNLDIIPYLERIYKTWKDITPKMHYSSPKGHMKKDFRSHHEYISSSDFIDFLKKIKKGKTSVDIMLEAKGKDEALFKLIRELKYKTNYTFVDETTFKI